MPSRDLTGTLRRGWTAARVRTRVMDPRTRSLPHFVIIGAQRSGTTTLYQHLADHPQVRPPLRKEVQFLSLQWERGLPWYRRHFPFLGDQGLRTLEASPYYLFHPQAPLRAAAALPEARFIAILREPSARALSHYVHNWANRLEPLSFEGALAAEDRRLAADRTGQNHRLYGYAGRGFYADQVRRWQAAVGDRLLVLLSDDLFRHPQQTLDGIHAFLGLEPWEPEGLYYHSPRRGLLAEPMSAGLRRRLQEHFAAPNRELAELIGRDLSSWSDGVNLRTPTQVRRVG